MQFLLDLQALQAESRDRGIGRYSRGLAGELLREWGEPEASVLLNIALEENFDDERQWCVGRIRTDRILVFQGLRAICGMQDANRSRARACEALYDAYLARQKVDVVHIASPFEGFGDDTALGWAELAHLGPARVATVYDLIPFEMPEIYLADPVRKTWYERRLKGLASADLLLAISEHTRQVAIGMLSLDPNRVVNISADTDPIFRKTTIAPQAQESLLARLGIKKPFVMHTGILEPRKNVELLVRAFARLDPEVRSRHELVLVGAATTVQKERLREVARSTGLDEEVLVFPGFVPDEDLAVIYGLTRAAVMPSLSEGFGLPMLEAMRCGAPVLAANLTSLPEVVGNQEYLFDPHDSNDLAQKLMMVLTDVGMRDRALAHGMKQEKRFSWKASAARTHEAFQDAVARRRGTTRAPVRQRYIVVPPADLDRRRTKRVRRVMAALEKPKWFWQRGATHTAVAVAYAGKDLPKALTRRPLIKAETIAGFDQRVVLLVGEEGLNAAQTLALSMTPAVVIPIDEGNLRSLTPELLYRLSGYAGLLAGAPNEGVSLDAMLRVQPNVLGIAAKTKELREVVEQFYIDHPLGVVPLLLARIGPLEKADAFAVAAAVAHNHAPPMEPRLLVDISELVHQDAKSGIQRVVRSALKNLLCEPRDLRIEPVYRDGDLYRYARRFTCGFLDLVPLDLPDAVVDFHPSDIFFGLDLDGEISDGAADFLARQSRCGTRLMFLVHDLIPALHPKWFYERTSKVLTKWINTLGRLADRLIAVSRATADDMVNYFTVTELRRNRALDITWSHNGCDLAGSVPTSGIEPQEERILKRIAGRKIFLTVGTIEPRKGIAQLLDAAETIWEEYDLLFVIVGRRGWNVDELITRIERHPERGVRLFWFEGPSDEVLERL
jgi:glycosyltransferase involved in cell wall biosynthesis